MNEPMPMIVNDPDPVVITLYIIGFLVAFLWNFYAIYKMVTLDHVKKELGLKRRLQAQGLWHGQDDEPV